MVDGRKSQFSFVFSFLHTRTYFLSTSRSYSLTLSRTHTFTLCLIHTHCHSLILLHSLSQTFTHNTHCKDKGDNTVVAVK